MSHLLFEPCPVELAWPCFIIEVCEFGPIEWLVMPAMYCCIWKLVTGDFSMASWPPCKLLVPSCVLIKLALPWSFCDAFTRSPLLLP